jgi:hypothetical protein
MSDTANDIIDLLPDDFESMHNMLNEYPITLLKDIRNTLTQGVEFNSDEDYEDFLTVISIKHAMTLRICDELIKTKQEAYDKKYNLK